MHRHIETSATDWGGLGFDGNPGAAQRVEYLDGLGNDLRTDAVAGKNCDFHRLT